jgi:outer membrane protein TolC
VAIIAALIYRLATAGEVTTDDAYTDGLSDFLTVLDAERTEHSARQQLVQVNTAVANDVVTLYGTRRRLAGNRGHRARG